MSALVLNEQVSHGLHAWQLLFFVCLSIAVPVIYGTMLCYVLLNRGISWWLLLLRYGLAWSAATVVAVLGAAYVIGFLAGKVDDRLVWWHVAIATGCVVTFWLAMRHWQRPMTGLPATAG